MSYEHHYEAPPQAALTAGVHRITISTTPRSHHYEEPSALFKTPISSSSSAFNHFTEKYDAPVTNLGYGSHNRNAVTVSAGDNHTGSHHARRNSMRRNSSSKLKAAKSLGSLAVRVDRDSDGSAAASGKTSLLEDQELLQIELAFKAHKTFVYVCRCLANLYFTKTDLINGGRVSSPRSHEWELARTGVPVIIFDKGETRARDKRQLQIALAERGTGFTLWKDVIDNLTDYKAIAASFHTMYLSCDHRKMAGLSFDCPEASAAFCRQVEAMTSDPLNIALSAPKRDRVAKNKLTRSKSVDKKPKPKKMDISSPCLFQHVTSVEIGDFDRLFSISSLMQPKDLSTELLLPPMAYAPKRGLRQLSSVGSSSVNVSGNGSLCSSSPSPVASSTTSENSSNLSL